MVKNLFNLNTQYSFIFNYKGVGEEVWEEWGQRSLNN